MVAGAPMPKMKAGHGPSIWLWAAAATTAPNVSPTPITKSRGIKSPLPLRHGHLYPAETTAADSESSEADPPPARPQRAACHHIIF